MMMTREHQSFRRLYHFQSRIYSTFLSKITNFKSNSSVIEHAFITIPGSYPQTNLSGEIGNKYYILYVYIYIYII